MRITSVKVGTASQKAVVRNPESPLEQTSIRFLANRYRPSKKWTRDVIPQCDSFATGGDVNRDATRECRCLRCFDSIGSRNWHSIPSHDTLIRRGDGDSAAPCTQSRFVEDSVLWNELAARVIRARSARSQPRTDDEESSF